MGKALSYAVREKIILRRKKGQAYKKIAEELDCSEPGVKKIWYAYQKEGVCALSTKYSNCGGHTFYDSEVRDAVKKIRDNQQGGSYVRSKLIKNHPDLKTPCIRTLTRWWLEEGTNRKLGRVRKEEKKKWTQEVHDIWQIDGKERVGLSTGDQVSWMNIADEASTSHLYAGVVNCSTVVQMDDQQATQIVNDAFTRWGLPKQIKIDNGHPFVRPRHLENPTKTKLWWIGLGINVIQNTLRCPQQNGAVECLQGIMKSWSNPKDQQSLNDLQLRLNQESDFQRNDYQIPSKEYKTRIELYPELESNSRVYDPSNFNMGLVDKYLSEQVWIRPVYTNGSLKFFGERIYIGTKFCKENLTITFNPDERVWLIRKPDGTLLAKSDKGVPIEKEIKDFALCQ